MRFRLVLVALILVLPGAAVAQRDPDGALDRAASVIAGRDVHVVCLEVGDDGYPGRVGAWGYVFMVGDNEFMSEEVCDGVAAIAAHDMSVPLWKQALGALVLTHESFHLNRRVRDPGSEARTECRAVKNVARTVKLLGGSDVLQEVLLPYELAVHWRAAALMREYYYEPCVVPNFWPPE